MEAIVLAGGFGTRLKHLVPDVPKPMAPVAGRPFLEILLTFLERKGFRRIILSVGYMAEKIVSHFGDRFHGMELVYEIEKAPLGTGGAVRQSLGRCASDHVFVFNGDTYLDLEVPEAESCWQSHPAAPLIVACEVQDTARYGRLKVEGDRVMDFSEKGRSGPGLINAGCYILPKYCLDEFPRGKAFSLESDFFQKKIKSERFAFFASKGFFMDIGSPEDFLRAQAVFGAGTPPKDNT